MYSKGFNILHRRIPGKLADVGSGCGLAPLVRRTLRATLPLRRQHSLGFADPPTLLTHRLFYLQGRAAERGFASRAGSRRRPSTTRRFVQVLIC
jgi:hypothetical protein